MTVVTFLFVLAALTLIGAVVPLLYVFYELRKGFVYCFYLVELENAIFNNIPIKTPQEIKSRISAMSIPVAQSTAKQVVQEATGVETNQTEQAVS